MKYFKLLVPLAICFFSFFVHADERNKALKEKLTKISEHFFCYDYYKKALAVLEEANENTPAEEIKAAQQMTNIFAIGKEFDYIPPAKAIPALFRLFEDDELSDSVEVFVDGRHTNSFAECVGWYILPKLGVFANNNKGHLFFSGIRSQAVNNWRYFPFFWYYAGYKYMGTLWNDWYSLWKKEQSRSKPREEVLRRLIREINGQFHYHIFPYVAEALKSGDTSLSMLAESMSVDGGYHESYWIYGDKPILFTDAESFLKFWEANKDDYIIPPPEHTLSDLEHICNRTNPPEPFNKRFLARMMEVDKALAEYCANPNHSLTNTWYYLLED